VREVLVDCQMMSLVDATGANALIDLSEELRDKGIRVSLARVLDPVRERLRRTGVEQALGKYQFHDTLTDGVKSFEEHEGLPS